MFHKLTIYLVKNAYKRCIRELVSGYVLLLWGFSAVNKCNARLSGRETDRLSLCYSWLNISYMAAHININQTSMWPRTRVYSTWSGKVEVVKINLGWGWKQNICKTVYAVKCSVAVVYNVVFLNGQYIMQIPKVSEKCKCLIFFVR